MLYKISFGNYVLGQLCARAAKDPWDKHSAIMSSAINYIKK